MVGRNPEVNPSGPASAQVNQNRTVAEMTGVFEGTRLASLPDFAGKLRLALQTTLLISTRIRTTFKNFSFDPGHHFSPTYSSAAKRSRDHRARRVRKVRAGHTVPLLDSRLKFVVSPFWFLK